MHISESPQKSIAILADSSSVSSVTLVSMTLYTRLHILSTLGRWVVTMQVLLGFDVMIFLSTLRSVATSSADVASSRSSTGASLRIALAIAMRCA